jgi:fumarate hydratase class I
MEAIYEFDVENFPVTVAVDSEGQNVHTLAPLVWRDKIAKEGLLTPA